MDHTDKRKRYEKSGVRKTNMRRKVIVWIFFFIFVSAVLPAVLAVSAFALPPQFEETYLGELAQKTERLAGTEGAKMIIAGGSSAAFGVRSDLMEEELGVPVVNWGLYAPLGSRTMLEACFDEIGEGDIVIFSPEQNPETLSFEFQAEEVWQAFEGDYLSMFRFFDEEGLKKLQGAFPEFAVSKLKYALYGKPEVSGIYRRDSFNEYGDIAPGARPGNMMAQRYDPTQMIDLTFFPEDDFLEYLNEYAGRVAEKGAVFYYRFCPMNESAVTDESLLDGWFLRLEEEADFTILGNPHQCVMESGWFYDTNFHLNDAGAVVNTFRFVRDIKAQMRDSSPTEIELPQMPEPLAQETGEDSSDAEYFIYVEEGDALIITGVTEAGAAREELTFPGEYEGKRVAAVRAGSLGECTALRRVNVQGDMILYDGCFEGCSELREIILLAGPSEITAGRDLLRGTDAMLYTEYADDYRLDYSWGIYSDRIRENEQGR